MIGRNSRKHLSMPYFVPIAYAILRFKPLINSFLTSFYLFAIHVVLLSCLLQSFNAK